MAIDPKLLKDLKDRRDIARAAGGRTNWPPAAKRA